jgi:alkylation response protein AidB-like acyl-CoA dehydrogenase
MFELTAEQQELYRSTVRFAKTLQGDRDLRAADRDSAFSREAWKRCAEFGLLGMPIPVEYGGSSQGTLATVVAFQALGYACRDNGLAFALASQLTSCQLALLHHGSPPLRQRYLPGLVSGELIAAHGVSEPDAGSDVSRVRTVARRVEGGYRLDGAKTFSSLGPVSDLAVVLARLDEAEGQKGGLTEFIVPRSAYRVSQPFEKIGLRTSPMSELVFEDSFVPSDHLLGGEGSGLFQFLTTMEWERLGILAPTVGAMERQLEECVAYARERKQFDTPIGKFQAVAHRIVEMKLRLETSRLLLYHAAAKKDRSGRAPLEAALVKLHLAESRMANAVDAVRTFGGYGCMTENEVERELRDAVPGLVYSGTADIQRNTIARLLGL